jgi:hypothetical protein
MEQFWIYIAKSGFSLFLDRTSEMILATFPLSTKQNLEGEILDAYHRSSREPWQDGNGFSPPGRDKRHLQVPTPRMRRCEILNQSPGEGHWNSYTHEVRHDFCVVDLSILGIVAPSLNRHGPGGLNQPTGKRPLAKLGSLRSETEEATFLRWRGCQCRLEMAR